jgi:TRAP-type mannitol/chloroaromatic compound transport system permease small subunit
VTTRDETEQQSGDVEIERGEGRKSVPQMVRWSSTLGKFAESIGKAGTLFFVPLILITVWDVLQRRIMKWIGDIMYVQGWVETREAMYSALLPLLPFRSTLLQELEWHFHTALFALVLGYGYIYNRHVRVDLVREKLSFRKQAWIELIGCTVFMIPFCLLVAYFAYGYAIDSYRIGEQSSSLVGLHNRWAIKAILVIGLLLAAFAGLAVWLQTAFALFGRAYEFPLYTIEREHEKIEKRTILERVDPTAAVGKTEVLADTSKLMSRQLGADAFEHATETRGQRLFFYYVSVATIVIVLVLLFHTFNFWWWIVG